MVIITRIRRYDRQFLFTELLRFRTLQYVKMKLHFIFLGMLMLLSFTARAQSNIKIAGQSLPELQAVSILDVQPSLLANYLSTPTKVAAPPLAAIFKNYNGTSNTNMPKAWAYEDLAFFCKIEVQMEKTAKLPIKVRIGEVQQVEKMEGKLKSNHP